jgi:hypothetical protein
MAKTFPMCDCLLACEWPQSGRTAGRREGSIIAENQVEKREIQKIAENRSTVAVLMGTHPGRATRRNATEGVPYSAEAAR